MCLPRHCQFCLLRPLHYQKSASGVQYEVGATDKEWTMFGGSLHDGGGFDYRAPLHPLCQGCCQSLPHQGSGLDRLVCVGVVGLAQ